MVAEGGRDESPEERFATVTAAEAGEHGRAEDLERAAEIVAGMGDATLLRSVAAVIVGFVVLTLGSVAAGRLIVGATGIQPDADMTSGFLIGSLVSRAFVAVIAGYLTSRAAPKKPFLHGLALSGMVAFLAAVALIGLRAAGTGGDPQWYPVAMLFVGPLGVILGASIGQRRVARV
jgi:hypothetical protein